MRAPSGGNNWLRSISPPTASERRRLIRVGGWSICIAVVDNFGEEHWVGLRSVDAGKLSGEIRIH